MNFLPLLLYSDICTSVYMLINLVLVAQSCLTLATPLSMGFSMQDMGVGSHFSLQGIFLIQGMNPGLPHCEQILYHLSHLGSPLINLA